MPVNPAARNALIGALLGGAGSHVIQQATRRRGDPGPRLSRTLLGALAGAGTGAALDQDQRAQILDTIREISRDPVRSAALGAGTLGGAGLAYNVLRDPEDRLGAGAIAGLAGVGASAGALGQHYRQPIADLLSKIQARTEELTAPPEAPEPSGAAASLDPDDPRRRFVVSSHNDLPERAIRSIDFLPVWQQRLIHRFGRPHEYQARVPDTEYRVIGGSQVDAETVLPVVNAGLHPFLPRNHRTAAERHLADVGKVIGGSTGLWRGIQTPRNYYADLNQREAGLSQRLNRLNSESPSSPGAPNTKARLKRQLQQIHQAQERGGPSLRHRVGRGLGYGLLGTILGDLGGHAVGYGLDRGVEALQGQR